MRSLSGTALALPLIEYTHGHVWGGSAQAAQNDATRRFITVFSHGGTISNINGGSRSGGDGGAHGLDLWRSADPTSSELVMGPINEALQPWADKLLLIEGIDNKCAVEQDTYNMGGHEISNATALTCGETTTAGDIRVGNRPSIDVVVAERLMAKQPVPFQQIHLRAGNQYSVGYGTPYHRAPDELINGEGSPQGAFETYFAGVSAGEPDPAIVALNQRRTSILNGLSEGYAQFRGRVSMRDQHAIDAHLDHLASLEQQLADPIVCEPPSIGDDDGSYEIMAPLLADIIVAALRCGLTNVANLEIPDMLTGWTPNGDLRNSLTFEYGGHGLGHLGREIGQSGPHSDEHDDWVTYTLENRRWRMSVVARIIEALDDPTFLEGDRTMLDNSLLLFTSEFSNASKHHARNVPVLLAGSAGGYFRTGRFVTYDQHAEDGSGEYRSDESTHNLYTSILQAMGEPDTHFGNDQAQHEGPLPDLT